VPRPEEEPHAKIAPGEEGEGGEIDDNNAYVSYSSSLNLPTPRRRRHMAAKTGIIKTTTVKAYFTSAKKMRT
jgi:hypothetical protein